MESTKLFVRWMDGTCSETPEQRGPNEDDEPVVFTFYWDVAANPQVGSSRNDCKLELAVDLEIACSAGVILIVFVRKRFITSLSHIMIVL